MPDLGQLDLPRADDLLRLPEGQRLFILVGTEQKLSYAAQSRLNLEAIHPSRTGLLDAFATTLSERPRRPEAFPPASGATTSSGPAGNPAFAGGGHLPLNLTIGTVHPVPPVFEEGQPMSILTRGPEARRSRRKLGVLGPSVREVRLLGTAHPEPPCALGAQVEWWGRTYRVEATQPPPDQGPTRYVYLTAEVGDGY